MVQERVPTTIELVTARLKRVMNPVVGLDLVRTRMITDIQIDEGTVRVAVDLPAHHQFASNIREEIVEKVETRWDVEKVIVEFTE